MLISLDYWGTLYDHIGTKKMRIEVVNKFIKKFLLSHNLPYNDSTKNIFFVISKYISSNHNNNIFPTDYMIGEYISEYYNNMFDKYIVVDLKSQIENLYLDIIKPKPNKGALDFIKRNSNFHRLCITSDTFFIRGRTIKQILKNDGVLDYFDAFFFSDEIGMNKTKHLSLESLRKKYKISKNEVVHIGDSLDSDGIYANNLRVHFIHYLSNNRTMQTQKHFVNSFIQIDSILKLLSNDCIN